MPGLCPSSLDWEGEVGSAWSGLGAGFSLGVVMTSKDVP